MHYNVFICKIIPGSIFDIVPTPGHVLFDHEHVRMPEKPDIYNVPVFEPLFKLAPFQILRAVAIQEKPGRFSMPFSVYSVHDPL